MHNVEIRGTGSYIPDRVVHNDELSQIVDTSDQWIRERTGIRERRISTGENTSELAVKAARKALADAEVKAEEIGLIIVATVTPDKFFPSTACIVQRELSAGKAMSFDISAACSGFIYALDVAAGLIKTGACENALVIGAEVLSKIIDWKDRNTCVLFADGAGAAVLGRGEKGIRSSFTGADGTGGDFLGCDAVPVKNAFIPDHGGQTPSYLTMNGKEVFKFAVRIMVECIRQVLNKEGCSLEEVKYIVPHQANNRIVEATAKKLGIGKDKFYMNLDKCGNTSGASIPLALDEIAGRGLLSKGDQLILVGFGAGLTYGAQLIEWTK
ncbi:3-oxoacyl-(acyl-carrier-protein) synthase III [Syntrophobotulus glycolicus DSM 8271]|uniref:Beta-ketoacyl-[acyl-carrier-protein] synthase III n=1 Tax=Syntrophobotulus glycolicus (strain DSM 8271 / FlGlyR) TaxID=645991 RepID=F0T0D4_SYNGF|nr:beta-ketoacyl-ACP synthase III [Syntrophobotulus glycolicus]ADY57306.1 3-oxoacyl-(acyl-carrier-protein) synthase III [Syntrophobotulus glycolicus DSM 8271]